jgi:hypothetical protein
MTKPSDTEIDDRVDAWHAGTFGADASLTEALGWSATEYELWLMNPDEVPDRPLPPLP